MRIPTAGLQEAIWMGTVALLANLSASLPGREALEPEDPGDPGSYMNMGDELTLKDGKSFQGTLLDILPDEYVIWTDRTKQFVPRSSVEFVQRSISRSFFSFFKKRQSEARTLKDWKDLGEFSRKKGGYPELRACMRHVIELDPKDEQAHRVLGDALLAGAWVSEKEVQAKLEAGYEVREGKLVKKLGPGNPDPEAEKKPARPEKKEPAKAEKKESGKTPEKTVEKTPEAPGKTLAKKEEKRSPGPRRPPSRPRRAPRTSSPSTS